MSRFKTPKVPTQRKPNVSEAAKAYRVKHVPQLFEAGEGFTDAAGRRYSVAPDGSLRRLRNVPRNDDK